MKAKAYLIVTKGKREHSLKLLKTKPAPSSLNSNQVAVAISVEIPDAIFERPEFSASFTMDEDEVMLPEPEVEITQQPIRLKSVHEAN